jgi:hypothetical protein
MMRRFPVPHCDGLTLFDADAFVVSPMTDSSSVKKPVGAVWLNVPETPIKPVVAAVVVDVPVVLPLVAVVPVAVIAVAGVVSGVLLGAPGGPVGAVRPVATPRTTDRSGAPIAPVAGSVAVIANAPGTLVEPVAPVPVVFGPAEPVTPAELVLVVVGAVGTANALVTP